MTAREIPTLGSIREFNASAQNRLFETLKQTRFSGELILTSSKRQKWIFYLYLGWIIYATGGTNLVRRWQRNLAAYCPQIHVKKSVDVLTLQRELTDTVARDAFCWEYQLLCLWVDQQKNSREQASKMVHYAIAEVFLM